MILYDNSWSGNCYKVRLLLHRLGIEYERHELDVIDRSDRPATLGALNPALRVPTLVLDDGRPLAESGAILAYLAHDTQWLVALYAYTHVAPEGGFTLEPYPAVRAWLTRFAALPGHIGIDA